VRHGVQSNPPLEFVGRTASVDGVLGLQILGLLVEANAIQLRIHRQPVRDVALADFNRLIASDSFSVARVGRRNAPPDLAGAKRLTENVLAARR
jgi:hypothetical protein